MDKKLFTKYDIDIEEASDKVVNDCKNEEIKENGFKVAFGIAIIIVGIFSIFYDTGNSILVGISISALLFTFIDAIPNRNNLLYIIPLGLLLIFCIFPQVPFIKPLYDVKFNNFIVFLSFGVTFIINSYTSFNDRLKQSFNKLHEDKKNASISESQLVNSIIIMNSLVKIRDICDKDDIHNNKLNFELDELFKYAQEEITLSSVRRDLIYLGIKNNSTKFTSEEIEKILIERNNFSRSKIDEKMVEFYNNHPEMKNKKKKKK